MFHNPKQSSAHPDCDGQAGNAGNKTNITREFPSLDEFRRHLEQVPCLEWRELMTYVGFSNGKCTKCPSVMVAHIVGGQNVSSWDIIDRHYDGNPGERYVYDMAAKINAGKIRLAFDYNSYEADLTYAKFAPPFLTEFFGLYAIDVNGNTRTAAHHGLNQPKLSIPAYVTSHSLPLSVWGNQNPAEVLRRKDAGLWHGTFNVSEGMGVAHSMEGPWVFARDMERVKELYLKLRPDLYPS